MAAPIKTSQAPVPVASPAVAPVSAPQTPPSPAFGIDPTTVQDPNGQAFLKAFNYYSSNPTSPLAQKFIKNTQAGTYNDQAQAAGVPLEKFPDIFQSYEPGIISRLGTDTAGHTGNIAEDIATSNNNPTDLGNAGKALDVVGNVAGEVGDFFGESLKSVFNALPLDTRQGFMGAVKTVAQTPEAQGALAAWNKFEAQNPDAAKAVGNVVNIGALLGGGFGEAPASEALSGAAKTAAGAASDVAGAITQGIPDNLPNTITFARDLATPIDENVMKVLQNPLDDTADTVKQMFQAAKTAVGTTGAPTPLEIVGKQTLGTAMDSLKSQMDEAGSALDEAMKESGGVQVNGDKFQSVLDNFSNGLHKTLGSVIDDAGNIASAPGRTSLIADSASDSRLVKMVNDTLQELTGSGQGNAANPTVQEVSDAVDKLQAALYKTTKLGAEPLNTETEGFLKQVVGQLNGVLKDATQIGGEDGTISNPFADANDQYSALRNLYNELSAKLGTNYKNAASIIKNIMNSPTSNTVPLMRDLEAATGQSIFHDSTIAKFAMESMDDPRAESLLSQGLAAVQNPKSIISNVLRYVEEKLADPEGKALRIIAQNTK